jgi:hypothetical protein
MRAGDSHRERFFQTAYALGNEPIRAQIRVQTYGQDLGQNHWSTAREFRQLTARLALQLGETILDIGCGSGGPLLDMRPPAAASAHGSPLSVVMLSVASRARMAAWTPSCASTR